MSSFTTYKKADLVTVLKKLDIHTVSKDTKKVLVDKLTVYAEKSANGAATVQKLLQELADAREEGEGEGDEDVTAVEEEVEVIETEDDDEEGDEEEDEEEGEEDDQEDKDYNAPPPLNFRAVFDPVLQYYEQFVDRVYECTDKIGVTYTDYSAQLRQQLSSTVTLNYLELILEFAVYLAYYVPLVPLNKNALIPQVVLDNVPFLATSTLPSAQVTTLFAYDPLITLVFWLLTSIAFPLVLSYFFNFTRRIFEFEEDTVLFRVYAFDPFIFALSKIFVYYLVEQSAFVNYSTGTCWLATTTNHILAHLGIYNTFTAVLGNWPYVIGGGNALIALYSQFEEY
ncbi:uncharacterized protein SPAPADRAFT_63227 [Spathaspora passalidarum NRRL Y-27907]|uniref:Uncharacterized protein n=1 Tax=Spathaspora passalidarum (strain NRRL Y-27907 / 11-Y1) TaxID=619300 RepID=G3AU04_SPAPN|nr:uncharacterized protein SPAPADRAFT_63227 [Spathaspora passalidarum NRRL Y-27907]EGW30381.1 hypothetical protein SPAPADRAFT_63227 [Spathaspora passalidarum NRRL Y-27907]